jgi:hypothetical protein
MSCDQFRERLLAAISVHLPTARTRVQEKRAIYLRVRAQVRDELFLDVYYNDLTGKISYTLIHNEQRVFGYDNYRFWHYHPHGRANEHIPCAEPEIEAALAEIGQVVERLAAHDTEAQNDSG